MKTIHLKTVLSILFAGAVSTANSGILTPDQAMHQAENFRNSLFLTRSSASNAGNSSVKPSLAYQGSAPQSEIPAFYVFNYGDGNGYAIISADDACIPVLGYVDNGDFNIADIPQNMKVWLEGYAREIAYASATGSNNPSSAPLPSSGRHTVEPLIKTIWDQGSPYNQLCPKIKTVTAPTGCTATAMAQIMNYHQWPQGYGSGSWSFSRNGISAEFDFSQTIFDWANMPASVTRLSSTEEKDAVATLMYACGVATDMFYSSSESGAYMFYVPEALIHYFGYDGMARYVIRDHYSFSEWEQMLYDELSEGRPVQYEGYSSEGGHSFVVDGYLGNNFFHINWGWGGMSDGYFALTALNPEDQGTGSYEGGYNSMQAAVIGIQPPAQSEVEAFVSLYATGPISLENGQAVKITSWLTHNSMLEHNVSFGIKAVPEDDTDNARIIKSSLPDMTMGGYVRGKAQLEYGENQDLRNFSIPFPTDELKSMDAGLYRIYPVYTTSSMNWEEIPVENGPSYITVELDGSGNLTTVDPVHPVDDLTLLSVTSQELFVWSDGAGCSGLEMMISNNSENDFDGKLSFAFTNPDNGQTVASGDVRALIPFRRALQVSISNNFPTESGNYLFTLYNGKTPVSDNIPVSVTAFDHGDIYVTSVELPQHCYENMDFSSQKLYLTYLNASKSAAASMKPEIRIIDRPGSSNILKTVAGSDRTLAINESKRLSYSKFNLSTDDSYLKAGVYYLQVFDTYTGTQLSLPAAIRVWKEDDMQENLFVGIDNEGAAYVAPRPTSVAFAGRPDSDPYNGILDIPAEATVNGKVYPLTYISPDALSQAVTDGIVIRSAAFSPASMAAALSASATETNRVYVMPENTASLESFSAFGIESYLLAPEISFELKSGDLADVSPLQSAYGVIHGGNAGVLWDPEMVISSSNENIAVKIGEREPSGDIPVEIYSISGSEAAGISITPRQPYADTILLDINGYGSTSVNNIQESVFTVTVSGMQLNISGADKEGNIAIYSATGECVANLRPASDGCVSFTVPSHGIYIIRSGAFTKKIII